MYIINIIIVYEADQETMHEFVKPLSHSKCIMIGIYFCATNKATTDNTLKT